MAEVRLKDVRKTYRQTEVVRGVTLTIANSEFLTLVGPSGCGKSTMLNMIAGLEEISGGDIFFDGSCVTDLPPEEREVAMVFQSYALYPHKTVYENVAFPLRVRKRPEAEIDREVRRVSALLGLAQLLDRKPAALSGGQRQRVALGRALVREAKVFLLDEPLSNLDAQLRVTMRAELKKLHADLQMTMVYVTHDQAEAMTLSDRVAILHHGVLQQCDTPRNVYNRPCNRFVAGFIGSPAMNFLDGTLAGEAGAVRIGEQRVPLPKALAAAARQAVGDGGMVVLGIRPEACAVAAEGATGGLPAEVYVVEPMGHASFVALTVAGQRLIAQARPDFDAPTGARLDLRLDPQGAYLFHPDTGEAIYGS